MICLFPNEGGRANDKSGQKDSPTLLRRSYPGQDIYSEGATMSASMRAVRKNQFRFLHRQVLAGGLMMVDT